MRAYGAATVAAGRTESSSLTLRDVFGAAESISPQHASRIVSALLASGRVRFLNAGVQRELDDVAGLLAADAHVSNRGAA